MAYKTGEHVEILPVPGLTKWVPAVYRGKSPSHRGLHFVTYRATPAATAVRLAVMAHSLRKTKLAQAIGRTARGAIKPRDVTVTAVAIPKRYPVLEQSWVESERGWGTRPDGETLHLTREDRDAYVKGYYAVWNNEDSAPDCYTRAEGEPRVVDVDGKTYKKLRAQKISKKVTHPYQNHGIGSNA